MGVRRAGDVYPRHRCIVAALSKDDVLRRVAEKAIELLQFRQTGKYVLRGGIGLAAGLGEARFVGNPAGPTHR